jgi:hypothetical protein
LLAGSHHTELANEYSPFTAHKHYAELRPIPSEQILEHWKQTGYTPSDW